MWKVSKYRPEKTPYLDTFHAVRNTVSNLLHSSAYQLWDQTDSSCFLNVQKSFALSGCLAHMLLQREGAKYVVHILTGFLHGFPSHWCWHRILQLKRHPMLQIYVLNSVPRSQFHVACVYFFFNLKMSIIALWFGSEN